MSVKSVKSAVKKEIGVFFRFVLFITKGYNVHILEIKNDYGILAAIFTLIVL